MPTITNSLNNTAHAFTSSTTLTTTLGNVVVTSGNITLPNTTSTTGIITIGGSSFVHNYGTGNTFIGQSAGNQTLTTASAQSNTGVGYQSLTALTTGLQNTGIGYQTLVACQGGSDNTAVGYQALGTIVSSGSNTAVGYQALQALVSGGSNTVLGYQAGINYVGAESSNVLIGNPGVAAESNVLRIGGGTGTGAGQQSTCFISGINGTTIVSTAAVLIDTATDQLGTVVSSMRYKENVQPMEHHSDPIMKLRPVTFTYKADESKTKQFGLIAEEVHEIMPDLVTYDKEGKPFTVRYHDMPAILLNEMQKQEKMINHLSKELEILEAQLNLLDNNEWRSQ